MDRRTRAELAALERSLRADDPILDLQLRAGGPSARVIAHFKALTAVSSVILVLSIVAAYPAGALLGLLGVGAGVWGWTAQRAGALPSPVPGNPRRSTHKPLQ